MWALKRDNRCFVCFKTGHRSRDCRLSYSCLKCNKKHNIALCQQQNDDQIKTNNKFNGGKESSSYVVHVEDDKQRQSNGPEIYVILRF